MDEEILAAVLVVIDQKVAVQETQSLDRIAIEEDRPKAQIIDHQSRILNHNPFINYLLCELGIDRDMLHQIIGK